MARKRGDEDFWKSIEEAQSNPEFIRLVYEFVRKSTQAHF